MRSSVLRLYWALFLISIVSSLLFLIVALEGAQAKVTPFHLEENDTYSMTYDNITLNYDNYENFESSTTLNTETESLASFNTNEKHLTKSSTISASFESITNDNVQEEKEMDVLPESFIQQPNLSQGISETGQAVVLTLVDTAAAELQNIAEPKIDREFSSKSSVTNSSLLNGNQVRQSEQLKETQMPMTQMPPPPTIDETTEQPNDTDILKDKEEVLVLKKISEETGSQKIPEAVVVKAEKNGDDLELRVEEEVGQMELPTKVTDDTFTTELNDSAARAQLVGGSRDDTAAVIINGFVTSGPTDPHEDIPSFSEWAQKRLEEAEKKKTHPNASVQTPGSPGRGVSGMKIRSKNYASPDCGAKIVAANPEASSAKNVLVSTRDEYMLNACTSRIWFVVELCEAIQAKKIELANFELFSSSPKDFSVYVSDRFPTKDWISVGQFTAKDVKDIQSFALHPHFFGKFIKVELQSHYGSEHFCPVSLFRAYGTSEFEVLETETENQILQETNTDEQNDDDSDEEELLDSEDSDPPRNLFGSARDAVLSIVKKAAEVLVKSSDLTGNNITEIQQSIDDDNILDSSYTTCMTPRYTIFCDNCSDHKFASVFQLVSCRDRQLNDLLKIDLMNTTLRRSKLCGLHDVEIESLWQGKEEEIKHDVTTHFNLTEDLRAIFLAAVFKPEYIVALCNVLATKERKVVMNMSYEISVNNSEDTIKEDVLLKKTTTNHNDEITSYHQTSTICTPDSDSPACKLAAPPKETRRNISEESEKNNTAFMETYVSTESLAAQIKPTKTLSKEDLKRESSVQNLEPSKESTEETVQQEVLTTLPPQLLTNPTATLKIVEELPILGTNVEMTTQTVNTGSSNLDQQDSLSTNTESVEIVTQGRTDKSESNEQISKQTKDLNEQEVHLTLDTLFDLKDLEGDTANLQNGVSSSASAMTQPTATTAPQKESVFLRLSNRIKTLERNMSLSGQYLEELSRRYKKQVEEMQRSLERALTAMNEESRKSEEREAKRLEEITALKEEIAALSKSVETLLYDRDSRISTIIQHTLLICLEIVVIFFIIFYCCRGGEDFEEEEKLQVDTKKGTMRRKSAESFGSDVAIKKTKKRRPSEIASHINTTYRELMIDDRSYETKKERKKKRKKEAIAAGTKIANSDAKQQVPQKSTLNITSETCKRPDYELETVVVDRFDNGQQTKMEERSADKISEMEYARQNSVLDCRVDEMNESYLSSTITDELIERSTMISRQREIDTSKNGSFKTGGILKNTKLTSPSFMKTALSTRNKNRLTSCSTSEKWERDSEHSNNRSSPSSPTRLQTIGDNTNGIAANGLIEESDESRSSSATPTLDKKEKKSTGLKKMVRKFF
ncbi:SUN domain-containing ossification factor isoform X2 [Pseudomyrmex gracilis]|uniref:SUN domain-containing ossification factor isoform X2 n=1 Tax=Pseudomyrmex gracilis TaxID=219809 RepID=UPI00099586A8|nr:SUN domain-containing ossification factor isoform X2 [Pseudomyrmex gracilis]